MRSSPRAAAAALLARVVAHLRERRVRRWAVAVAGAAFGLSWLAVVAATQFPGVFLRRQAGVVEAGRVAERDIVVDRDFVYVDESATRLKQEARAALVPPVFALNDGVSAEALTRFDAFASLVLGLQREGVSADRFYLKVQVDFPGRFRAQDIRLISARADVAAVLANARSLLEEALAGGIINLQAHRQEIQNAGSIELWRIRDNRVQTEEVSVDRLAAADDVPAAWQGRALELARDDGERRAMLALLDAFAVENAFYDAESTDLHRARARGEVEPVTEHLARGQVLARRGDIVSESTALRLKALGEFARTVNVNQILGGALLLAGALALAAWLLSPGVLGISVTPGQAVLLAGLSVLLVAAGAMLARFAALPSWLPLSMALPVGAVAMTAALLVSGPAAVIITLASSLALVLLAGLPSSAFLFGVLSGAAAAATATRAERRIDLVKAGLQLAVVDALIAATLGLLGNLEASRFLPLLGWGAANGFLCGILTLGFLPVVEHLLNAPTRFRLMELSDLNAPVFRRMLQRAPGTYTHSIAVANLAESACEAIGANALLARVSAYYHDIGKIDQAEYFIENQRSQNKHDDLSPSLSVAVIKSHVRIGIEKARELGLPQAIVDVIAQHHGRGLITYFYHRAVSQEREPSVSRDDYSYPGVRPRSREAAVLMLADNVEAASRTLKRPTEARLERFVQEAFDGRLASGELGDSGLTLRDLETIRRSFVRVLEGQYHARIEYPRVRRPRGRETP
jgi:putative nucleotidyltransferase with HDIG domain